jgi:hypothetical protein
MGLTIDPARFTGYFIGHTQNLLPGDYILTGDLRPVPSSQIGRITSIGHDTVYLDQVGLNVTTGVYNLFQSIIYYTEDGFVFNCRKGDNRMTAVQPVSDIREPYSPGTRFSTNLFPKGAYVIRCDTAAGIITMSAPALASASDVSLTNGDPEITMTSEMPPSHWIGNPMHKIYGLYPGIYRQGDRGFRIRSILPHGDSTKHKFNFDAEDR